MIINIPLAPMSLQFLKEKFRFKEIYKVSTTRAIDNLLMELLEPKPRSTRQPFNEEGLPVLQVQIYQGAEFNYKIHLSNQSIAAFNRFVDEWMKSEFISHTEALCEFAGYDINEAIYHFIEKYQFDGSAVTFESLKKYYYRYRMKIERNSLPS